MDKNMTAQDLASRAHTARPEVIYRAAVDGGSVAAWHDGRWVVVAGKLITGGWASLPYELLVDGKPAYDALALYREAPKEAR